jgi:hypothetical protein
MQQLVELDLLAPIHEGLIVLAEQMGVPLKIYVELVLTAHVRAKLAAKLSASQYSRPSEKRATPKAPHSN